LTAKVIITPLTFEKRRDRQTDRATDTETPDGCFMLTATDAVSVKPRSHHTITGLDWTGQQWMSSSVKEPSHCTQEPFRLQLLYLRHPATSPVQMLKVSC